MKIYSPLIAAVFLLVVSSGACTQTLITEADEVRLLEMSRSVQWRQLLAYDSSTDRSAITNASFFLSDVGHKDSYAELLATIAAFSDLDEKERGEQLQCRFPGRYLWLNQKLDFTGAGVEVAECPEFRAFSGAGSAESVSIIFATGYLGNPASYYGHLLLKINTPTQILTDLESVSVNFGARIPPNENMLAYITKGIVGSYDASFTHQQYFYHTHNYGETELRDLWEYELDLEPFDRELLIAHTWELIGQDYRYYFFNRNCAYRMGELLRLVVDDHLVDNWRPWETPQAIVQRLGDANYEGRPLLKSIRYHPSRQSRLYQRYAQLGSHEQDIVSRLVKDPATLDSELFLQLELEQQFRVLDTLLDYYQFVRDEAQGMDDIHNIHYWQVLRKRYQLPSGGSDLIFDSHNQPHLGRKPSYVSVGIAHNEARGDALSLRLRPAYYDSLDAGYGHIRNASLSMGELELAVSDQEVYVRELNLVRIENFNRSLTGLPGDTSHSWYLELGAEQHSLGCTDCLAIKLRSGYGYGVGLWGDKVAVSGLLGAGFLDTSWDADGLYGAASLVANIHLGDLWSMRADIEQRLFRDGRKENIYQAQLRVPLGQNTDVRMRFAWQRSQEVGVSVGFYW